MSVKYLYDGGATSKLWLDRRKFYLTPQEYAELWPNVTPFSTLLQNTRKKSNLPDPLFKLFEHENPWIKQEMTCSSAKQVDNDNTGVAGNTVSATTGLVDHDALDDSLLGLEIECWDSTRTTKRGTAVITAVVADTSFTVKNLTTTAFTTVSGDIWVVMGNVRGEGSTAGDAWSDELSVVYNSTQFFSKSVEITGKLYKASLRGANDELARLRKQKGEAFKMQQEHAYFKGQSVIGTGMDGTALADTYRTDADGNPLRTTMGIIPVIETYGSSTSTDDDQNIFNINPAVYDYSAFVDDMEKVFQYESGSGQKFAFCGPGAMSYWSKLDSSQFFAGKSGWSVQLSGTSQNKLGFNVRKLETPHGILHLVPTKALKYAYNNYMVVVDESNLFHAEFEPNMFKHNIKTEDDYNGVKDVYTGDSGIGVTLQKAHQLFKILKTA